MADFLKATLLVAAYLLLAWLVVPRPPSIGHCQTRLSPLRAISGPSSDSAPLIDFDIRLYRNIRSVMDIAADFAGEAPKRPPLVPGFAEIFDRKCDAQVARRELELLERKLDLLKKETRLTLQGGGAARSGDLLEEADRDPTRNWYVGLSLELAKEGLIGRRIDLESMENERRIQALMMQKETLRDGFYCRYNSVIVLFAFQRLQRLRQTLSLLQRMRAPMENLYYMGKIYAEDLFEIDREIARARNMADTFAQYIRAFHPEDPDLPIHADLPVLALRMDDLVRAARNDVVFPLVASLEKRNVENRHNLANDIRLNLFARQYHDMAGDNGDSDLSCGFRFEMPLPLPNRAALIDTEKALIDARRRKATEDRVANMMEIYYDAQYKIDDIIKLRYQRETVRERFRRLRGRAVIDFPRFAPLDAFKIARELGDTEFQILEAKEKLYLRIAKMIAIAGVSDFQDYVAAVDLDAERIGKIRPGHRGIYVWTATFNRMDSEYLLDFLKVKTIDTVLLSLSNETDLDKMARFLRLAADRDISVHCLLSATEWIFPENRPSIDRKLALVRELSGFAGLHLDVEPHTLKDWRDRRDEYMALYIDMLQHIASAHDGPVGVSIPVFYDNKALEWIFAFASDVSVMAYGIHDAGKMREKLADEIRIGKTGVGIALRCDDFQDEQAFEAFIARISDETRVENFYIYDLDQYMELVKKKAPPP